MKIKRTLNILMSLSLVVLSLPFLYLRSLLRKLVVTKPAYNLKARNDTEYFKVDDKVKFKVFWKNISTGCGPAVCLFIYNKEVLKYDCLGPSKGHFHITLKMEQ